MMTKTYDNNLQVFEGCKILRQKRNYFKMFKGVKLSKEKFQHESQKTSWDLYELKSWSVLCRKVVKSLVSHGPEITHECTQKLSSLVPPISESCWDQVMLQRWLLDSEQAGSPVSQVLLSQGLLHDELQHGGFILVAASCPQLLFLWRSPFSIIWLCVHPSVW